MRNASIRVDAKKWNKVDKTILPFFKITQTTGNLGDLIPLLVQEILPGETITLDIKSIVRIASTFIKAPLTDLILAIDSWFVSNTTTTMRNDTIPTTTNGAVTPYGAAQNYWKYLMGERDNFDDTSDDEIELPLINWKDLNGATIGSETPVTEIYVTLHRNDLLHYLGLPLSSQLTPETAEKLGAIIDLPVRAYKKIWNDGYRDQNHQEAKSMETILVNYTHTQLREWHNGEDPRLIGKVGKVNKIFDYFTRNFIETQKGNEITLPLTGFAPVAPYLASNGLGSITQYPMLFEKMDGTAVQGNTGLLLDASGYLANNTQIPSGTFIGQVTPANLQANMTDVGLIGINDIRAGAAIQRQQEIDLVSGTRYFETLYNYFGVSHEAMKELDYAVLIGSKESILEISQVVQTSTAINENTTQPGNIAGYLAQAKNNGGMTYTAKEHGFIIINGYVRHIPTYQQKVERLWKKIKKKDYYNTIYEGIGMTPTYVHEIYGYTNGVEGQIFGYRPYGDEHRYPTHTITGQINSYSRDETGTINTLEAWQIAEKYNSAPTLNSQFRVEDHTVLDRTLTATSEILDQFIFHVEFNGKRITPVSATGQPGIR